jgi:hypothetical protein
LLFDPGKADANYLGVRRRIARRRRGKLKDVAGAPGSDERLAFPFRPFQVDIRPPRRPQLAGPAKQQGQKLQGGQRLGRAYFGNRRLAKGG